jgi:hypothetical protein
MKRALFALVLMTVPAAAAPGDGPLYALYAGGHYEEAMREGAAARNATGYAIAARAALAEAVLRDTPCMSCLKRGEDFARRAVAADPGLADGQIWLAVALGYETRIDGLVMGRLHDAPAQSKAALDAALKSEPQNPYGVAALGGWNIEVVRGGGAPLAKFFYDATEAQALQMFDQAAHLAPGNVAVRYQIALSLAGFDPDKYRARIDSELTAALRDAPATVYEKAIQSRAADLQALLRHGDGDALAAKVRKYQGYPG